MKLLEARRAATYAIVGGSAALIHLGVFSVLVRFLWEYAALLISLELATILNFFGQVSFTFPEARSRLWRRFVSFHVVTLATTTLNALTYWILRSTVLTGGYYAQIGAGGASLIVSFLANYLLNTRTTFA